MQRSGGQGSGGGGSAPAPARLWKRVAPHLFLACFVLLALCFILINGLQARAGDVVYEGPLPDGEAVPFTVAAGDVVDFRVEAHYAEVGGDQESTLTVRDPSGAVVYEADAGFRVLESAEPPDDVEPPLPPFRAEASGEHALTWTYRSGTPSTNEVEVVANGYRVEGGRANPGFALLVVAFVAGAAGLVGTRPTRPDAQGWRRLWPVVGVTPLSAALAILAGVAMAAAFVAWLGGRL